MEISFALKSDFVARLLNDNYIFSSLIRHLTHTRRAALMCEWVYNCLGAHGKYRKQFIKKSLCSKYLQDS